MTDRKIELEQRIAKLQNELTGLNAPKPMPLPNVNTKALMVIAMEYIDSIHDGTYCENDEDDHYFFEAVIEAVYGKDIWDYISKKLGAK